MSDNHFATQVHAYAICDTSLGDANCFRNRHGFFGPLVEAELYSDDDMQRACDLAAAIGCVAVNVMVAVVGR